MSTDRSASPSLFLPWVIVLTSALFFFYAFIHMNMLNALGDELSREFGFNAQRLSQVYAFFTYGNLLFLLPAGLLLDRFSPKKLLIGSFLISVVASYFFSMATSFAMMGFCRFFVGLGAAFSFLAAIKIASCWFEPKYMAFAIGMVVTIGMLGGLVSQTPLAVVTTKFGWRYAAKLIAHLGLAIVLLQILVVKDASANAVGSLPQTSEKKEGLGKSIKMALLNRQNWFAGLYTSLINLPVVILGGAWGVQYLVQVHKFAKIDATHITSMIFIGMIIGSPVAGWVSDRLNLRKLPMIIGALLFITIMAMAIFPPALSLGLEIGIYLLIGILSGAQVIGYPIIAESNPPSIAATATSLASILIVAGGMLVPLYGWLLDKTDANQVVGNTVAHIHSQAAFFNANTMMLIGAGLALIIACLVRETYGKPFAR